MQTRWLLFSLLLYLVTRCNSKNENYITSYGAVADGITNNSASIQQAIDEVSAAGGGQGQELMLDIFKKLRSGEIREDTMWGELPAWGFYIRHAEGIKMKNNMVSYLKDDFRPALLLDDVKGLEMTNFKIPTATEMPVVVFNNTSGIVLNNLEMPVSEEKGVVKTNFK